MPLKREDIKFIREARAFITEHYDKHITIPQLAKKTGINEAKLKEGFRELYGQSIHEYIQSLRLEKAKQLLRNTDDTITDVTYHIGYSQVTHFTNLFKKVVGMTPSEWRKKFRK